MIEEHVEKMKGMTCVEKARYVLEFVLHQPTPLTKSKYWSRVYHYFYREMHYQKSLETNRKSNNKRCMRLTGKPHKPTPRLRIPQEYNSRSDFLRDVRAGYLRLCCTCRRISRYEAIQSGLRFRVK